MSTTTCLHCGSVITLSENLTAEQVNSFVNELRDRYSYGWSVLLGMRGESYRVPGLGVVTVVEDDDDKIVISVGCRFFRKEKFLDSYIGVDFGYGLIEVVRQEKTIVQYDYKAL